jgi:hypothetical protein
MIRTELWYGKTKARHQPGLRGFLDFSLLAESSVPAYQTRQLLVGSMG